MKFIDIIILSKALDKIDTRKMIKTIESNINLKLKELKKELHERNIKDELIVSLLNEERESIFGKEALLFIVENLYKIEDELLQILKNNSDKSIETIREMEHTELIDIFKGMFSNGVPKVIMDKFNLDLDLKKTL
jgi:hypothetical protein